MFRHCQRSKQGTRRFPKRTIMEKATIKEIAALAGVSPTAVSFVINGRGGVSPLTEQKILDIIKKTGYSPNAASRQLTSKISHNIAIFYPASASPFSDLFYCEVTDGLVSGLTESNYNAVFCPYQPDTLNTTPDIIRKEDAAGAIFFQDVQPSLLAALGELKFPYVILDSSAPSDGIQYVSLDCEHFIMTAMEYLVEKGHSRIAFLGIQNPPAYYLRCFSGYQKALVRLSLPLEVSWIQQCSDRYRDTRGCMERLWAVPACRPTALCCSNDLAAAHAIQAAFALKIEIPEQLSIISIDDTILSRHVKPSLTSVHCSKRDMGRMAAELILKKIREPSDMAENPDTPWQTLTIMERESVKDIRIHSKSP